MLDISSIIKGILNDNWIETNPALKDFLWEHDEFNPNWGKSVTSTSSIIVQVLFENYPDKKTFVARTSSGNHYRVIHSCRMSIYLKPTKYDNTTIEAAKVTFFKIKTEIDRILSKKKFNTSYISNIEMTGQGWSDGDTIARGRGIKAKTEPILWVSTKIVTAMYYIVGG